MMKSLIVMAALASPALLAQTDVSHAFQQPEWVRLPPGGNQVVLAHSTRPDGQTGPVIGKPFSGAEVRHTSQVLADGTHVDHTDTSAFYRDAQGRMRAESKTRIVIDDPVAQVTYSLDPQNKTYTKFTHGDGVSSTVAVVGDSTWTQTRSGSAATPKRVTVPHSGGPLPMHTEAASQAVKEDLPAQMVNGIYAKGSRVTMTIPLGAIGNDRDVKVVNERWYSDDLQVLVKSANTDPRFGVSTYDLTNIVQAAPDPALFQVPPDYTEGRR